MRAGDVLTPLDSLSRFSCFRLASRISDLRKQGIEIQDSFVHENGKKYKRYWIKKEPVIQTLV